MRLERSLRAPRAVLDAALAVVAPNRGPRRPAPASAPDGGGCAFWRCANERAQAQARRGRDRAARPRGRRRPGGSPCSCARCASEGQAIAVGARRARRALPPRRRGGASSSAPRSRTCSPGCGCSSTRATPAPSCARSSRPPVELRAIDVARVRADRAAAQARHGRRARRRDRVAADPARGARPHPRLPQAPPRRSPRSSTRAPDLFVHRLIDRLGLRRQQLFARRPTSSSGSSRWRASATSPRRRRGARRRRPGASSRGTSPPSRRPGCARRTTRPRSAARDAVQVMAMQMTQGATSSTTCSCSACSPRGCRARAGVALEPIPDALLHEELPADTRDAHVAEMRRLLHLGDDPRARGPRARLRRAHRARRAAAALAVRRGGARRRRRRRGRTARRSCSAPTRRCTPPSPSCATSCCTTSRASPGRSASCAWTPTSTSRTASCATWSSSSSPRSSTAPTRSRWPTRCRRSTRVLALATTAQQREMLETSPLDELILDAERDARARAGATARARRAVARGVPAARAATGSCSAPRTSTPTGRAR